MISFSIGQKQISLFPSTLPHRPVIYLHTFGKEGEAVSRALQEIHCPAFTLAAVSGLQWDHDMTPWAIPPISQNDTPCTGGAQEYLGLLVGEILPRVEQNLLSAPSWRGIAGYSLGGLFAVYSLYQTYLFSRAASVSGSLWFPGIKEYIFSHEMKAKPRRLYFSLGNKECKTRNPYLKTVQQNTQEIYEFYRSQGVDALFQLNPGNHFVHAPERIAAGIGWMLEGEH